MDLSGLSYPSLTCRAQTVPLQMKETEKSAGIAAYLTLMAFPPSKLEFGTSVQTIPQLETSEISLSQIWAFLSKIP